MAGETCMCDDLRHEDDPRQVCGKAHTVIRAIDRQIDHYGCRGESEAYNRRVWRA